MKSEVILKDLEPSDETRVFEQGRLEVATPPGANGLRLPAER